MKALVTCLDKDGKPSAAVTEIPKPKVDANSLLIKVHAIALNPVDALYIARAISKNPTRVVGSDIAGTVVEFGSNVTGWKVGDRVAALLQGACSVEDRPGGFAEFAITPSDLAIKIPSNVTFEEAATLPLCALTSAQALFQRLGLAIPFPSSITNPIPTHTGEQSSPAILIYGASTSIGMFAIQLAKLCRTPAGGTFRVYATASQRNHAYLKQLGADVVVDYRSPTWPEDVFKMSGGVSYAYDCISEGSSTGQISQTFIPAGGKIAVVRSTAFDSSLIRPGVITEYGAVWSGLGVELGYNNGVLPADPISRQFAVDFFAYLSAGATHDSTKLPIQANPIRVMPGGLENVVRDGFALLGSERVDARSLGEDRQEEYMRPVSAEKLVYLLEM